MRNEKSKKNSPLALKQRQAPMVSTKAFKQQLFSLTFSLFSLLFSLLTLLSCSSAPAPVADIYTIRNRTIQQLDLANQTAQRGLYEDALLFAEEARRLAISTDDPSLRIQSYISRGNIRFSLGEKDQAFQDWEIAAAEGDASGEAVLAAQARILQIRASLLLLDVDDETSTVSNQSVTELKAGLERLLPAVRQDPNSSALWYITFGLAERQQENWTEAESSVRRALDIYVRNTKLEDAAYAWFIIASIRSLSGNYNGALEALRTSIEIDRRVENGYGLANSWQAMGDVYQKASREEEARAAWHRAEDIFEAIGLVPAN